MPTHTVASWSLGDITTTGPNPFADGSDPNNSAPGNSTITINAPPVGVTITDNDSNFSDGDSGSQRIGGVGTDTEYSYVVRPAGSSDPADNVTIYAHEVGGTLVGILANDQLQVGVTYDIVAVDSSGPSVPYTSLFVCYAPGTLIGTSSGDVPVEDLGVGQLLLTADRGPRPIRWIGHRRLAFPEGPHKQKPIEIKAGALGGGLPRRRLIVSPQHRVLIDGPVVREMFGEAEVLALAKGLVGLAHVRAMNGRREVTYYSLLCDRHEVIMAEGAWSESFYPGPTALEMIGPRMRREVEAAVPALAADPEAGYGAHARRVLTRRETEALVAALAARGAVSAA